MTGFQTIQRTLTNQFFKKGSGNTTQKLSKMIEQAFHQKAIKIIVNL